MLENGLNSAFGANNAPIGVIFARNRSVTSGDLLCVSGKIFWTSPENMDTSLCRYFVEYVVQSTWYCTIVCPFKGFRRGFMLHNNSYDRLVAIFFHGDF